MSQGGEAPVRFPIFDGLRSLVIVVLLFHFTDSVVLDGWDGYVLTAFRYTAVIFLDVFFLLSGFLITGILLDTKHSGSYFRTFYARRFLRIFPLYYGFLVIYFVVVPWAVSWDLDSLRLTPIQHFYYWGYLTNFAYGFNWPLGAHTAHLWSLSVEEQFYLLWPGVVYVCSRSRLKKVCLACMIVAPLTRLFFVTMRPDTLAFHTLTFARMDGLALGALLAVCAREAGGLDPFARWTRPAAAVAASVALAMVFLESDLARPVVGVRTAVYLTASVYLAGAVLMKSLDATPGSLWHKAVASWPLRRIGLYSYALYVLHDPLAYLMDRSDVLRGPSTGDGLGSTLGYCGIMIVLSLLVAALSWHLYEEPLLKLKRHFPYAFDNASTHSGGERHTRRLRAVT